MGKRGPKPTPTEILKLHGSWRGKLNKNEPKPEPGRPTCPSWISDSDKRVWKAVVPILEKMRVLTKADLNAVTRYCVMFSQWRRCVEFVAKHGETYTVKDAKGRSVRLDLFPQVKLAVSLGESMLRLEAHFGLTPSARSRIEAAVEEPKNTGKARFFKDAKAG